MPDLPAACSHQQAPQQAGCTSSEKPMSRRRSASSRTRKVRSSKATLAVLRRWSIRRPCPAAAQLSQSKWTAALALQEFLGWEMRGQVLLLKIVHEGQSHRSASAVPLAALLLCGAGGVQVFEGWLGRSQA